MKKWIVAIALIPFPVLAQQESRDWDQSDEIRVYQQLLAEANDRLAIANARIDQMRKHQQLKDLENKPEAPKQ